MSNVFAPSLASDKDPAELRQSLTIATGSVRAPSRTTGETYTSGSYLSTTAISPSSNATLPCGTSPAMNAEPEPSRCLEVEGSYGAFISFTSFIEKVKGDANSRAVHDNWFRVWKGNDSNATKDQFNFGLHRAYKHSLVHTNEEIEAWEESLMKEDETFKRPEKIDFALFLKNQFQPYLDRKHRVLVKLWVSKEDSKQPVIWTWPVLPEQDSDGSESPSEYVGGHDTTVLGECPLWGEFMLFLIAEIHRRIQYRTDIAHF
jgi:hypothetical protein